MDAVGHGGRVAMGALRKNFNGEECSVRSVACEGDDACVEICREESA